MQGCAFSLRTLSRKMRWHFLTISSMGVKDGGHWTSRPDEASLRAGRDFRGILERR